MTNIQQLKKIIIWGWIQKLIIKKYILLYTNKL